MATCEEDGPEVLPLAALDQELRHALEPVATLPLQGQDDGRPLQLGQGTAAHGNPVAGPSAGAGMVPDVGVVNGSGDVARWEMWAGQWGAGGTPWA